MAGFGVGDVVAVKWFDAWADGEEHEAKDWIDECVYHTYGLIVDLTPTLIRIAQDVFNDRKYFRAVTSIPLSIVDEVTVYGKEAGSTEGDGSQSAPAGSGPSDKPGCSCDAAACS